MRLDRGTAEQIIASALERQLGSVPSGRRLRIMLEEAVFDRVHLVYWPGPHTVGWVERPTPGEMRVRLLDRTEAGRTARALLEDELLDVVPSRDFPPVIRLTSSADVSD